MMPFHTELQFFNRLFYKYSAPDGAGLANVKAERGHARERRARKRSSPINDNAPSVRFQRANAENLLPNPGGLVTQPTCNSEPRQGRHICRTLIREDPGSSVRSDIGLTCANDDP